MAQWCPEHPPEAGVVVVVCGFLLGCGLVVSKVSAGCLCVVVWCASCRLGAVACGVRLVEQTKVVRLIGGGGEGYVPSGVQSIRRKLGW